MWYMVRGGISEEGETSKEPHLLLSVTQLPLAPVWVQGKRILPMDSEKSLRELLLSGFQKLVHQDFLQQLECTSEHKV